MIRAFLGVCLGTALVWATAACSAEVTEKTEGNKICTTDDDCSEPFSKCEHINNVSVGTCTRACNASLPCPNGFNCRELANVGLALSCLQDCRSKPCPSDHNCITNSDDGSQSCAPNAWFAD